MPVVICESSLPDGNWKDVLGQVAPMADAPRLIVTSFHADDRLWAEVLNMGGFDVLLKPLDESEVLRVVDLAWRNWEDERQRRKQRWKVAAAG
jgi:FixJ family two-component response regulator